LKRTSDEALPGQLVDSVAFIDNETANLRFTGQVMKALDNFGVGHPGARREKQQDKMEGVSQSVDSK
jgi:hypothetical protein